MEDSDDRQDWLKQIVKENGILRGMVFNKRPPQKVKEYALSLLASFDENEIITLPDLRPYFFPVVVSKFYDGSVVDNLFSLHYLTGILSDKALKIQFLDKTTTSDFISFSFEDLERLPTTGPIMKARWYQTIGELCLLNLSFFKNSYYFRNQTREILGDSYYEKRGIKAYNLAQYFDPHPIKKNIFHRLATDFSYFSEGFYSLTDEKIFPGIKFDRILFDMMPEHKKGQPLDTIKEENNNDYRRFNEK